MARWNQAMASRIERKSIEQGIVLLKKGYFLMARAASAAQDGKNKRTLEKIRTKLLRTFNRVAKSLQQKH